jgi:hypothetical protein
MAGRDIIYLRKEKNKMTEALSLNGFYELNYNEMCEVDGGLAITNLILGGIGIVCLVAAAITTPAVLATPTYWEAAAGCSTIFVIGLAGI